MADIYTQCEEGPLGNGVHDPVSTSSFALDKICQEKSENVAGQLLALREIMTGIPRSSMSARPNYSQVVA